MKRVRRKERSKEQDEFDENDRFSILPLDLKTEILVRLPAKSVAKFIFVSKFWSSIICSKDFTDLYLAQSSTRPRLLFIVHRGDIKFFRSFSQESPPSDQISINTPNLLSGPIHGIFPPVRGLICYQNDTKVLIGNPSTGQSLTLPRVKTRRSNIVTFFGYDSVNDLYKVLCITLRLYKKNGSPGGWDEHQVFTLGPKQKWRLIECKHPHDFSSLVKSLCMNGVVYYIAYVNNHGRTLVSFDLSSEEFNVTKPPGDLKLVSDCELVNYNGKIALTSESCNGTLDLWVLEDASKQEWSKVSVVIPSWTDLVGNRGFTFIGVISTGELIFAPRFSFTPFFFLYYHLKENRAKKVPIEGTKVNFYEKEVFLDHVESPMIWLDSDLMKHYFFNEILIL